MCQSSSRSVKRRVAYIWGVLLAAASSAIAGTPTITNINTSVTYASLQVAIDDASPGDLIELTEGTLFESGIDINQSVIIRGQGMDATVIDADSNDQIFRAGPSSLGSVIEGLTIVHGLKHSGQPGGMLVNLGAQISIRGVRFNKNNGFGGGALGVSGGSALMPTLVDIEGCEFVNNEAMLGGGIVIDALGDAASVNVANTLFAFNSTNDAGAAAAVFGDGRELNLTNCTFAGNTSNNVQSLLYVSGSATVTLVNSVVVGETGTSELRDTGGNSVVGHSLLSPGVTLVGFADMGGNITASPVFEDELMCDYRLAAGSPGIDAASETAYSRATTASLDLNGEARFYDDPDTADTGEGAAAYLDMGAYEFQGSDLASITNLNTGLTYGTVQEAINAATAGDTILLGSGVVYEHGITVSKPLTIRGQGMDSTTIDGEELGLVLNVANTADGTMLEDFTVTRGLLTGATNSGGLFVRERINVSMRRVRFVDNTGSVGGAVGVIGNDQSTTTLYGESCEFLDNTADARGGALAVATGNGADITLINCLFRGNQSLNDGAAVHTTRAGNNVSMINCTFAENNATQSTAIVIATLGGGIEMANCVVVGTPGTTTIIRSGSSTGTVQNTLFAPDVSFSTFTDGGGNIVAMPIFEDAANGDYRLAAGSPGIDAAGAGAYFAFNTSELDLSGVSRFYDDPGTPNTGSGPLEYLDMGAYEYRIPTAGPITNIDTGLTYGTIQKAINAASAGDTLEIGTGAVYESSIMVNKPVTIRGQGMDNTLIDGEGNGRVFTVTGMVAGVVLEDLTVARGQILESPNTGGLFVQGGGSVTMSRVRFFENIGASGGTVAVDGNAQATTLLFGDSCEFMDNFVLGSGAMLAVTTGNGANVRLTNCLFRGTDLFGSNNAATVKCSQTDNIVTLVNCTFAENTSEIAVSLPVIKANNGGTIAVANCVIVGPSHGASITGSSDATLFVQNTLSTANVSLSFVTDGGGNIVATPSFEDDMNGDYRLAAGSPGIDAGDADAYAGAEGGAFDLNGDPRFHDDAGTIDTGSGSPTYLDMGAYEFQGSSPVLCPGDVDGSNTVDVDDLNAILGAWNTSVTVGGPLDLANDDGFIDVDDLNVVLGNWGNSCG
ncbi:MAG: hypothetical protein R3B46_03185 [Phycisphaerales bacterium]|nr:hypothetical protein [Phycisphaerales bacterium]